MTTRLYYTDPGLLEFEARVADAGKHDDLYYTVLDQSAFYPTSGGQQYDTGQLDDVAIVDVIESDEGDVWHLSKHPVGEIGQTVSGKVDKERRRRHQRQHTAQHILSQSFKALYDFNTVSVHLGEEYGAIEFDTKSMDDDQLARAEEYALSAVFENMPVEIFMVDAEKAATLPLRKTPKRSGQIRVIKIGEFDWTPCGGTHCRTTAEVVLLKLVGTEKIRGHVLVKFLSGTQAVQDYLMRFKATDGLSQRLTCHVSDLPDKFDRLQNDNNSLRKELGRLNREMLPVMASQLADRAFAAGETRLVLEQLEQYDKKLMAQLAAAVAEAIDGVAALYLEGRLVVSASETSGKDAGKLVAGLTSQTGLKGGGSERQAQLGGSTPEQLAQFKDILIDLLTNE
ncbi:MAG: hypothetical protein JSU74_03700 [Candidatus Zixiibacteriota bacterium]|nr:MAG: hypothetical protein JSU74_03700 [candidate division Zixibacteria bacterium]